MNRRKPAGVRRAVAILGASPSRLAAAAAAQRGLFIDETCQEKSYSHPRASRSSRPRSSTCAPSSRREVAERIKEAREFGDISENAEYDHAKNEQAMLEARIAQLEDKLRNATVIDEKQIDTGVVSIGSQGARQGPEVRPVGRVPDRRLGGGRPVREQALQRVAGRRRPARPQARRRRDRRRSRAGPAASSRSPRSKRPRPPAPSTRRSRVTLLVDLAA